MDDLDANTVRANAIVAALTAEYPAADIKLDGPYGCPANQINWYIDFVEGKDSIAIEVMTNQEHVVMELISHEWGPCNRAKTPEQVVEGVKELLEHPTRVLERMNNARKQSGGQSSDNQEGGTA